MKSTQTEIDRLKSRAKSILSRLKALGFSAGLQQSYELLAAADGHRNWATMKAAISDNGRQPRPEISGSHKEYSTETTSGLVQEMLRSDGKSVRMNAKIYEALGYTLEWKMCQPSMLDSIFDNTRRPRPFIVSRPPLMSPIEPVDQNDIAARRAEVKRKSEAIVNGDLLPIAMSLDGGMVLFNGLKAFDGCSLSIKHGGGSSEVILLTPSGRQFLSSAKTVAMALCVCMVRMVEQTKIDGR